MFIVKGICGGVEMHFIMLTSFNQLKANVTKSIISHEIMFIKCLFLFLFKFANLYIIIIIFKCIKLFFFVYKIYIGRQLTFI